MKRRPSRSIHGRSLLVTVALAIALATTPGGSHVSAQQTAGIAPEALAQIAALAAEKAARTPEQRKISAHLLYAARMARGEAIAAGIQTLEVYLPDVNAQGAVLDVRVDVSQPVLDQFVALGAEILDVSAQYRNVRLRIDLSQAEALAMIPQVSFIQPKQEAITSRVDVSATAVTTFGRESAGAVRARKRIDRGGTLASIQRAIRGQGPIASVGSRESEGDAKHGADSARTTFGVNGTGVRIGVLSDGVTNLAASQALGDLPPGVVVLPGQTGEGDEGTAMLEIIHDLAPGAELYFATALTSIASFAQNIRNLHAAGCDIIVDDVGYFAETPFQDGQTTPSQTNGGIVIQAVKDVTAAGALYFSSAANSGNKNDGTSGTWEGDFVDGGDATGILASAGRVHDFDPGAGVQLFNVLTATIDNPITLYWADPLDGSSNDYDVYRLNSTGTAVLGAGTSVQSGTQDPFEIIGGGSAGHRVVIVKFVPSLRPVPADRFLHLATNRNRLSISTAGETHGHAATTALNSFGVAATSAQVNGLNPFTSSHVVETFSSDGPRRIFFQGNGTAITPGNFTATGGQVLQKPDITAADGVSVTGVGGFPILFFGTSASAPHAAAIAALVKSRFPAATASHVREALLASAIDIEALGIDRDSGHGIIMADVAVGLDMPPTTVNDTYSTAFQMPLSVAAPGVLGNDNSHGGGAMSAAVVTGPTRGVLTLNGNGSFLYTPNSGLFGDDSFTYRATSSVGPGNLATVTITVGTPPPPTSADDTYATPFQTALSVSVPGVLGNDDSHGGGAMSAVGVTGPANGSLALSGNGSFLYTPNSGFSGNDSFTYRATNAGGPGNVATVTITVNPGAPTSIADTYATPFQTALSVATPGVLANDNSNSGGAMTAAVESNPASGALALNGDGSFLYTPNSSFFGNDSFTYRATNRGGAGNVATVTITVSPGAPTSIADTYATPFQTALSVAAPGVLANDNSNGGGTMTAAVVSNPASGTLAFNANGGFSYAPISGFSGSDSFTYRATNSGGAGNVATVTIAVSAPTAPISVDDAYTTPYQTPLSIPAPGVLANDNSNRGGAMTAAVVSNPASGTLAFNANGSFTYTPNSSFAGHDSFTYRATNSGGPGNVATVTISVEAPTTPQAPSGLRVSSVAGNLVTLRWTPSAIGPPATTFVVEGGVTPGGVLASLSTGDAAPIVTFAAPTGSFFVRVHQTSGADRSPASNEILLHVNVPVPPSAPDGLLATVNGASLDLVWRPTFGGGAPTSWLLDVTGSLAGTIPLPATSQVSFPVVPDGTYTVSLRAQNAGGASGPSNPVTIAIPGACTGAPLPPAAFLFYTTGSVATAVWDPASSGAAPSGYIVNVTGAFSLSIPTPLGGISGAVPPGTYAMTVVATNACGASAPTPPQSVSVP